MSIQDIDRGALKAVIAEILFENPKYFKEIVKGSRPGLDEFGIRISQFGRWTSGLAAGHTPSGPSLSNIRRGAVIKGYPSKVGHG